MKNFVKSGNLEGKREQDFYGNYQVPFDLITRKAVVPANEEIERNPRARSAKLRIAEKNEMTEGKKIRRLPLGRC